MLILLFNLEDLLAFCRSFGCEKNRPEINLRLFEFNLKNLHSEKADCTVTSIAEYINLVMGNITVLKEYSTDLKSNNIDEAVFDSVTLGCV